MRKKFAVLLLSVALGASVLNGCKGADKRLGNDIGREWEDKDAVYGEVSKVEDGSVTIKVGTRKEMEKPQDGDSQKPDGKPSMIDLTGEEQEITVTGETVIKRQVMGGMRGMPGDGEPSQQGGQQGEDGKGLPQKPDGQKGTDNGEPPEKPDGNAPGKADGDKLEGQRPGMGDGEEIAVSDISEGDIVMVIFAEGNSAKEITVMPVMGGGGENGNPPSEPESQDSGQNAV